MYELRREGMSHGKRISPERDFDLEVQKSERNYFSTMGKK